MKHFIHLLRHDFRLLVRNNVIAVTIVITLVYLGLFLGFQQLGDSKKLLILIIFNDPALVGFLFIGVLVLFEKNERTQQALAVTPMKVKEYIWSKSTVLTLLSVVCCSLMAFAAVGGQLHWGHFILAALFTTLLFSFLGFAIVAGKTDFNSYLLPAIGWIILLAVPFLGYFEVLPDTWFILFPTYPLIKLFSFALAERTDLGQVLLHYSLTLIWCYLSYKWALRRTGLDLVR